MLKSPQNFHLSLCNIGSRMLALIARDVESPSHESAQRVSRDIKVLIIGDLGIWKIIYC